MQIFKTYYLLGKLFVYKLKTKEASETLKLAQEIVTEIFGSEDNNNLIFVAKCQSLIKEGHLKAFSQRNPSALNES